MFLLYIVNTNIEKTFARYQRSSVLVAEEEYISIAVFHAQPSVSNCPMKQRARGLNMA